MSYFVYIGPDRPDSCIIIVIIYYFNSGGSKRYTKKSLESVSLIYTLNNDDADPRYHGRSQVVFRRNNPNVTQNDRTSGSNARSNDATYFVAMTPPVAH